MEDRTRAQYIKEVTYIYRRRTWGHGRACCLGNDMQALARSTIGIGQSLMKPVKCGSGRAPCLLVQMCNNITLHFCVPGVSIGDIPLNF